VTKKQNWMDKVNPVVRDMPPSGIRKFFDLAVEMEGVISLGVGEPDFVTPWHIREGCIYSLEKGYTMYTSNQGLLELRQAIAQDLYATYGVSYDPKKELLITVGVSEGLDLAVRTLVCPGDEVIIPEPSYVSYMPAVSLSGGVPVSVRTVAENKFRLTAESVEKVITPHTKVLMLSYPNNPTGAVMRRSDLYEIAEVIKEHDLLVISDEVYDKLTYTDTHTCFSSIPDMKDRTVLLNGFSKAYAMTGWRIGYAVGNTDIILSMNKVHQYTMLCAPVTAQMAALEAIKNGRGAMCKMVQQYNRRRQLVMQSFKDMGLPCFEPGGAFYAFPDISAAGLSSEEFAQQRAVPMPRLLRT